MDLDSEKSLHYPSMIGRDGNRNLKCKCGFKTNSKDQAMDAIQQYAYHFANELVIVGKV